MILIVDLNPIVTTEYYLDEFKHRMLNRADKIGKQINGEGIYSADFLNSMNIDFKLMSFCGRKENCTLSEHIQRLGFPYLGINISDNGMEACQIITAKDRAVILGPTPKITQSEIEDFYYEFTQACKLAEVVVIVGGKIDYGINKFAQNLIRICYRLGKKVVISSENDQIYDMVKAKPYLAILEKEQLENISNVKLEFEWEIVRAINTVLESGVGALGISDANKFIYIDKNHALRIRFEDENLRKDRLRKSVVASGFALGLVKNYDINMSAKIAIAAGLSGFNAENRADSSKVKQIMNHIEIEAFNV